MSTPQQASLKSCSEKVRTKKYKSSRSMRTILSELVLCVSMAGGGKLPTGETSQSSGSGSGGGSDNLGNVGAMERGGERSRAMVFHSAKETMAKYGFHYSNDKLNGPVNVMHRFIKWCLEGTLSELDSGAVWDHPLWSKLLTHATITKSMPVSKVETKMVPLMSSFKDWENALRSGLGLKVLSSAETYEPKDLLLCQLGGIIERNKVPTIRTLRTYHFCFKHLVDRLSGTESGELCDGLLFALKCMVAQYVSRPDSNYADQIVSFVCAIIRGDTGELLRLVSESDTQTIEHKQMKEHGFVLSIEGAKNAFGAMHRFILHCFKSWVKPRTVNHQYVNALWANPVWSRFLKHANVTQSMQMSTIRDQFLASIMTVMKHVENSVRSQLGLKPLVLPAPQESFVVCHLARLSEICRSSRASDLEFDTEVTSLKVLIDKQSISVTETPGSSHAKGVEWLEKLSDLKVDMNDLEIECEKLVSSVLDDAFKFDVDEMASTSAVRIADLLKANAEAKAEAKALAKIKYDQYVQSRMTEVGLGMSDRSFFGLIQFLFGTQIKTPDSRAYPERIRFLKRCPLWKSLLGRVESMEGEYLSPEQLVEQLYETENRLRRHFGLQTIVKDPRNLRNERAFLLCHLVRLCNFMESWEEKEMTATSRAQLRTWKKNFYHCFPTLPASHHLLKSTLSSIEDNCNGWEETVSQAMNAVCRLIQSEDVRAPSTSSPSRELSEVPVVKTSTIPFNSICGPDLQRDEGLFHDCRESDTESQNDLESTTPTIQSLKQTDIVPIVTAPNSSPTLIDSRLFPLSPEVRKRAMEEMDAESHALLKRKSETQSGPSMKKGK